MKFKLITLTAIPVALSLAGLAHAGGLTGSGSGAHSMAAQAGIHRSHADARLSGQAQLRAQQGAALQRNVEAGRETATQAAAEGRAQATAAVNAAAATAAEARSQATGEARAALAQGRDTAEEVRETSLPEGSVSAQGSSEIRGEAGDLSAEQSSTAGASAGGSDGEAYLDGYAQNQGSIKLERSEDTETDAETDDSASAAQKSRKGDQDEV